MKLSTILLLTSCILLLNTANAQTIRIADNNLVRPTGTNVYSTLQAAINAAQPDDIVYITPSNTSYGDATIAKRIVLQGVGFNVGLGDRTSTVGTISLNSSTDGINSCSGSTLREFNATTITLLEGIGSPGFNDIIIEKVISSISTSGTIAGFYLNRAINNLIIRNSQINNIGLAIANGMTNCKVYNNTIRGVNIQPVNAASGSGILNNLFSNNIFIFPDANNPYFGLNSISAIHNTLILNNIFSGASYSFLGLVGTTVNNNIFYGMTPTSAPASSGYSFRDNNFSNNLVTSTITMPPAAYSGGTNSGVNNLVGVSPNFLSVAGTAWSAAYDYSLNPSSPAKNAGTDGTDIGPTGGAYPINKNIVFGPAALPLITELNTSGVVPQNQPLKVNLKAKSN